jgi:chemotaxis signal transduction protein
MDSEGVRFLLVRVGGRWFAVEAGQVETLRRRETLYPPPAEVPYLVGLLPVEGHPVPVVDLAVCLGISDGRDRRDRLILVGCPDTAPLAFLVQAVSGPVLLPWTGIHALPPLLVEAQVRPVVWAMIEWQESWIPALDLGLVLPEEEVNALQACARAYQGGSDDAAIAA